MDSVIYASFWVGVPLAVLVAILLPRDWRTARFWLVFAGFLHHLLRRLDDPVPALVARRLKPASTDKSSYQ
jgi:hypothetical protein